jgi:hypothetical protein
MTQGTAIAMSGPDLGGELADWLSTAPFEFVACREARHSWPIDSKSMEWKADNWQGRRVWVRVWVCEHGCGVIRTWRRDFHTGENLGSTYLYPSPDGSRSGYLLPAGSGGLSSDDIFRYQMATHSAKPRRSRRK